MKEELGEIIYNIFTENYKDKIGANKDLIDYLRESTKDRLLSLYLSYGYAANIEDICEQIYILRNKKKEQIIENIINFLDNQIVEILKFFSLERIKDIKNIANTEGFFEFVKNERNGVSLDTIKILKQLGLIFCKKDKENIIIHMPDYIKNKICNIIGNLYSDYYDKVINYTKGIADTYGAIHIEDAYDIIRRDILIKFDEYESMIKFVCFLELEPICYSFEYQSICNFNIGDEEINELLIDSRGLVIYDCNMYTDIGKDTFILKLKEYKEFRNFLKDYYSFDINEDEILRGEIINDYIDICQIDENSAKEKLNNDLDSYFEIDILEKKGIIEYIDTIKERFPVWKNGGRINHKNNFAKIGRNELCPCGSGKKYKNCCGK